MNMIVSGAIATDPLPLCAMAKTHRARRQLFRGLTGRLGRDELREEELEADVLMEDEPPVLLHPKPRSRGVHPPRPLRRYISTLSAGDTTSGDVSTQSHLVIRPVADLDYRIFNTLHRLRHLKVAALEQAERALALLFAEHHAYDSDDQVVVRGEVLDDEHEGVVVDSRSRRVFESKHAARDLRSEEMELFAELDREYRDELRGLADEQRDAQETRERSYRLLRGIASEGGREQDVRALALEMVRRDIAAGDSPQWR